MRLTRAFLSVGFASLVLSIYWLAGSLSARPFNIPKENLEESSGRPRSPFMAPQGCTNLALGKSVTSSDEKPVKGRLEQITDGLKDSLENSLVELNPGSQWVQIDLGAPARIYAIVVWHGHEIPYVFHGVVVQVSTDPDFVTSVTTLFNSDLTNTSGVGAGRDKYYIETNSGRLLDAKGIVGRYVRLYSNGNCFSAANTYTEVDVYGLLLTAPLSSTDTTSPTLEPLKIELPKPGFL
ncbi:MAG: discoidin domain-containing protein [Candidatus Sumerlaeota bacterium]|nr:discoidin domain-containing protein [Candidatus Sumerlaeota bacterium]